jgi:hypothetical protein
MIFNAADRWRRRAEEARALAEKLNGDQARASMLEVAAGYDKLARRAEERGSESAPSTIPIDKAAAVKQSPA